jgi:mannose-1-phosphate guanylyltransferase
MPNLYVVIMAGGIGSRFWPSSRMHFPKQFLDILGVGKSLLRLTYERFLNLVPAERILIVTNAQYADLVQEQLPELSRQQILLEPSRNNTAPCIAYAALKIQQKDPQAVFVVAPSDHLILKEGVFLKKIEQAYAFASQHDALLTLGIQPHHPNTGYGYIRYQGQDSNLPCVVEQFTEKPDLQTAQGFLAAGNYLWNAGIFIWSVPSLLKALQTYTPKIYELLAPGQDRFWTAAEQDFINQVYPLTPNISIDYAVMEKAPNIYTLPADIGWSDLGTWASLYEQLEKDGEGNAINGKNKGTTWLIDSQNCLVRSPDTKLVIVKDLNGYIVVDEDNTLLIYPKDKEQEIKQIQQRVAAELGPGFA